MKLIIGLGNPGKEYAQTRHNVGFMVLDEIARDERLLPVTETELKFKETNICKALVAETHQDAEKVILVKPQTFMNNSGECVRRLQDFYKVADTDIWVVTDDLDLPIGTIRVRLEGSSGGHKGLESIIHHISSEKFPRIRTGIGEATQLDMKEFDNYQPSLEAKDFVLAPFTEREMAILKPTIKRAADIIIEALQDPAKLEAHTYEVE